MSAFVVRGTKGTETIDGDALAAILRAFVLGGGEVEDDRGKRIATVSGDLPSGPHLVTFSDGSEVDVKRLGWPSLTKKVEAGILAAERGRGEKGQSPEFAAWDGAMKRLVDELDAGRILNRDEMEKVRTDLAEEIRGIASDGADRLTTLGRGGVRVLVPASPNLRQANLTSRRVRERFTNFRLSFLNKDQVAEQVKAGTLDDVPVGSFVRYSKRLARAARIFLAQALDLEPDFREEIDETLAQIDDAENDLLKLEVRSFTNVRENIIRSVNGRATREAMGKVIETFDLNRALFNLSLLAHPEAVTRALLANASDRLGERVTSSTEERPKRAWVVTAAAPNAIKRSGPDSRTARLVWRVWNQADLQKHYDAVNTKRTSASSWRGLGAGYGTHEIYVPIPEPLVDEAKEAMRARRRDLLERLAQEADRLEGGAP